MPDTPTSIVRDNVNDSRFEIDLGDGQFAFADYLLRDDRIIFTHTEVPPSHGGQGLGTLLVRAALTSARERGLRVVPICPFFAAYIKAHEKEQDLLDASSRTRLGLD